MNKSIKQNLKNCTPQIGGWITLYHPAIAEIMVNAGYQWIVVDLEHSSITIDQAENLIRTIALKGAAPLVRLSGHSKEQIKRVMDSGAQGIIAPMVKTVAETESLISHLYYSPIGQRGVGLARAQGYGTTFKEYLAISAENSIFIVQVEHIETVQNLKAILANKHVDGFLVGPYDLSASMGIAGQFEHPDFLKTIEQIEKIGLESKKSMGVHVVEPSIESVKLKLKNGYSFIAYSLDTRILDVGLRAAIKEVKL